MKNWVGLILMYIILKGPVACFQIHVTKALKGMGGEAPEMVAKYAKGKTENDLKHS